MGNDWWYERSNDGDYVNLKIGDPDREFMEEMTYVITYEIKRAVSFKFDDHDELYWNATGDEWGVPIINANATITFPDSMPANQVIATCFTGGYGSNLQNCSTETVGNMIIYESNEPLFEFEGLTIVAGFPKGILTPPSFWQGFFWTIADNWGYFLPILTFLILYYLWWTRGRDEKTHRDTVMPIYKPPEDLTPSEVGTLIDESADMHDLSATIVDMAVRGYLKIKELEKGGMFSSADYMFELLKPGYESDSTLHEHEKATLKAIFTSGKTKKLSSLKYKFYEHIPKIKNAIYKELVNKKFFPTSPDKVRSTYYGLGGGLAGVALFTIGLFVNYSIAIPIGAIASGIIIIIFAKYMPAKTKKGSEVFYKVLGVEEFIKTAERDRIKWQEKENMFEQLLPYAMALGIADKWANTFKDTFKKAPDWYSSSDPNYINNFNTGYFLRSLNSLSNSMNTNMTAAPRSSGSGGAWSGGSGFGGGGFSGGGFGGGGGGSW
jgi:uncharacterized membrane protein